MKSLIKGLEAHILKQEAWLKDFIRDEKWNRASIKESYIAGLRVALEMIKQHETKK